MHEYSIRSSCEDSLWVLVGMESMTMKIKTQFGDNQWSFSDTFASFNFSVELIHSIFSEDCESEISKQQVKTYQVS